MSSIKTFTIGQNVYTFICSSRNTRSGFAHDCELIKNTSSHLGKATCHYLNRTWECYSYQSVMIENVRNRIADYELAARDEFKREHNLSRITAKRRPELDAFIEAERQQVETWNELTELLKLL